MNEKIKKLAKNIVDLVSDPDSLQDLYDNLVHLMNKQSDYFRLISPENQIKLLFYIWSLKKSNNFEIGEFLLNQIEFAHLIMTEGDFHKETCEECSGNGETRCGECDGSGEVECGNCDGSGKVECGDCGGSGVDDEGNPCDNCGGDGEENCGECDSSGKRDCGYCNGGYEECRECDGSGDAETDELDYYKYFICTWNKEIKDRCEITAGTPQKTMDEYDFDRLRDQYIILTQSIEHSKLLSAIETNEIYCTSYDDMPNLISEHGMRISSIDPNQKILDDV
jgi:hypothetical protein